MTLFKYPLSFNQKLAFVCAILLCLLCIAWEWFISPLRPNGSWMVLKCIPLGLMLPGLYRGKNYQSQATSMIILLYFLEGFARLFEPGLNWILASVEVVLSSLIFYGVLMHLGPLKKAAKAKKESEQLKQQP
ncbi:hypothetical protein PSHI8_15920 [Polynucleobacter sp. SHI8]|uniref:DUF2069 domain-containing protein n=1 Tax=unclassified Polynucleobacter TaxID=2640945 RepID=UPI0024921C97|nr:MULTISPECIES: DUF2069 domain-containing protein [unclassified Polynucleobacter]BDW11509.1 hypothetical protein PSHI2_15910 [Polynucleobacter sp. SHI2]BDW13956.1 hypothetical protein PSHI8_15920 [Polynucleobacter sp. SHI8]